jgi:hypothetical protein
MKKPSVVRPYLNRLAIVLGIALAFALAFNEISYFIQKDRNDRAPKTIQLIIPAGTAARVEQGEAVPSIPSEMSFVTGDVLEVVNQDSVPHQLGPVWVPPGTTGKLAMEKAANVAYTCSFQPSRYLGLDIRQPTTLGVRLVALAFSVPTVGALLFIYSLLVFPVKPLAGSVSP